MVTVNTGMTLGEDLKWLTHCHRDAVISVLYQHKDHLHMFFFNYLRLLYDTVGQSKHSFKKHNYTLFINDLYMC